MNLVQFIKLILKHLFLLLAAPAILAFVVFYTTRNEISTYSSKTTVYTGIASGYNLETDGSSAGYFGTSNAFDNLLNIINSRDTREKTALKLLSIHLSLNEANPKYINQANYNQLQNILPEEIKKDIDQIKKDYKHNDWAKHQLKSITKQETVPEKSKNTNRSYQKFHFVKDGETLYSIAKLYGVSVADIMKWNTLPNNEIKIDDRLLIEVNGNQNNKPEPIDSENDSNIYYIVQTGDSLASISVEYNVSIKDLIVWNHLKSRSPETGTRLIVGNKYKASNTAEQNMNTDSSEFLRKQIISQKSDAAIQLENVDDGLVEEIFAYLEHYKAQSNNNFIYELLNYSHPIYSISAISRVRVKRIANSDLVEISYGSADPGICQLTLEVLTEVFIENYKNLKENQTDAVVKYFQRQVDQATHRLQLAEDKLLSFNKGNSIINYYEQTKFIASEKEDLDVSFQDVRMEQASASAALKKIEDRLNIRGKINLASTEILKKRKELADITAQIALTEAFAEGDSSTWELVYLNKKSDKLKADLEKYVNDLYGYTNSVKGMPADNLLQEWLTQVIAYEESSARLKVLEDRKKEFIEKYNLMAPLGATLKRIEREIDVAEQEYLSLLHSLNQAKLKQQNVEFSSNIKAVDKPYYPIQPEASKRKLLIIAAAFAGFILTLAILVLLEYFDSTLKTPERTENTIGLKVATIYPKIPKKYGRIYYDEIVNRLSELLVQNIKLNAKAIDHKPIIVNIISTSKTEGKTFVCQELQNKLHALKHASSYINLGDYDLETLDFATAKNAKNFVESNFSDQINSSDDFIILELPDLLSTNYDPDFIRSTDLSILVVRSNRSWNQADIKIFDTYKNLCAKEPLIVLNGTHLEALETTIGDIPRQRSFIRKLVKKLLKFQLHNKSHI